MRPELSRLAVLAAALAPGAAERLVLLVAEDSASAAAALAAALALASREARVDAVAAAFADPDSRSQTTADGGAHPLLQRLAREERARARSER
jgi:hypothetical protein